MRELRLPCDHCFHYDLFNFVHEGVRVATLLCQNLQDSAQTALVPCVALLILAVLVVVCELVDGVVGEVHEDVVDVAAVGLFVRLRAKPGEGHLMHENAQGVHAIQKNVDSKVVLKIIDQVGPVYVFLDDVADFFLFIFLEAGILPNFRCDIVNVIQVSGQEDAFALGHTVGLHDVGGLFLAVARKVFGEAVAEVVAVIW